MPDNEHRVIPGLEHYSINRAGGITLTDDSDDETYEPVYQGDGVYLQAEIDDEVLTRFNVDDLIEHAFSPAENTKGNDEQG